jgi:hypothetical protein
VRIPQSIRRIALHGLVGLFVAPLRPRQHFIDPHHSEVMRSWRDSRILDARLPYAEGEAKPRAAVAVPTTTSPDQRLKLQTSYDHAMMFSRGFGPQETKATFTRVHELASKCCISR